jgi:hypothetical protein
VAVKTQTGPGRGKRETPYTGKKIKKYVHPVFPFPP